MGPGCQPGPGHTTGVGSGILSMVGEPARLDLGRDLHWCESIMYRMCKYALKQKLKNRNCFPLLIRIMIKRRILNVMSQVLSLRLPHPKFLCDTEETRSVYEQRSISCSKFIIKGGYVAKNIFKQILSTNSQPFFTCITGSWHFTLSLSVARPMQSKCTLPCLQYLNLSADIHKDSSLIAFWIFFYCQTPED